MVDFATLTSWFNAYDWERIRAVPDEDVEHYVAAEIERAQGAGGDVNADRLHSLGHSVARTGHDGIASGLVHRVAARATERGLDVACCVLSGIWAFSPRRTAVSEAIARELIEVHRALPEPVGLDPTYSFASALCSLVDTERPGSARSLALSELKAILEADLGAEASRALHRRVDPVLARAEGLLAQ